MAAKTEVSDIPGVRVEVRPAPGSPHESDPVRSATTEEDGTFELEGLPSGPVLVRAEIELEPARARIPGEDDTTISQIAREVTYVPLRSREWGSPEFLTPAADAPPDLPGRFGQQQSSGSLGTPNLGKQE